MSTDAAAKLVPVDGEEVARAMEMSRREPYLAGAIERVCRGVCVEDMVFPDAGLDAVPEPLREATLREIKQQFWAPIAQEYIRYRLVTGYLPFQLTQRRVVAQAGGGVALEPGPERPGEVRVVVPTVPDPSTYRAFVGITPERERFVVCAPLHDDRFESADVFVVSEPNWMPDPTTGRLTSPVASLLRAFDALERYDQCEMQAAYAGANVPVVYQHVAKTERDAPDLGPEMPPGMEFLTGVQNGIPERVRVSFRESNSLAGEMHREAELANPALAVPVGLSGAERALLRHAMMGPRVFLPPDKQLAGNVPEPRVPPNLRNRREAYQSLVSVAIGIPASYLGAINSRVNLRVYGDIEVADFVETVSHTASRLERALGQIYFVAMQARGEFKVPIFVMQPVGRLRELLEMGAITHETMRDYVYRMTGVAVADHDTRLDGGPDGVDAPRGSRRAKRRRERS